MSHRMRSLLLRSGIVLAVVLVAFVASGVILAQASEDFDLGCRSVMTAGGYAAEYAGVGVILHSSVGQPTAGRANIQFSNILLESGYILPVAQTDRSINTSASAETDAAAISSNPLYLPAIYSVQIIRYVRPCNWSWNTTQVAQ